MSWFRLFLCSAITALAFGCGGGEDKGEEGPAATNEATLAALNTTNLSSSLIPWNPGELKRWNLPIPVKLNGEPRATAAIDEIERKFGFTVFDRTSIANTPDNEITRGLIISVGTAVGAPGQNPANICGSGGPPNGVPLPPPVGWTPQPPGTVLSERNWVNIDGPVCVASVEVTIHEFMHVMGMWDHFEGFGIGPAISDLAWRVFRTIYTNPAGTRLSAITLAP